MEPKEKCVAHGQQVTILKGDHQLVVGTRGCVLNYWDEEKAVYEVVGQSALHLDRLVINELFTTEFEEV